MWGIGEILPQYNMTKVLAANFKRAKKKKDRTGLMFKQLMDSRTFDYVLGIRHFDFQI